MNPPYKDSFDSNNTSIPIVSDTKNDDYLVVADQSRKIDRKWLLIMLLVMLVFAGVILVGYFLINNSSGFEEKFNRFGNYILVGDDTTMEIPVYDEDFSYYFIVKQATEEEQEVLYAKTRDLLNDFVKSVNNDSRVSEEMKVVVEDEQDLFEFMETIYTKRFPGRSGLSQLLTEKGSYATIEQMNEYYNIPDNTNNKYLLDFKEAFRNWVDYSVEEYEGNETDDGWMLDIDSYFSLSNKFVNNIFIINDLIKGESNRNMAAGESE